MIPVWRLADGAALEQKIQFMRTCSDNGIQSLVMHSRAGSWVPYASREWYDMITELVNEGARLGMQMWLSDDDPCPSGGGGGLVMGERPDLTAYEMKLVEAPDGLAAGGEWEIGQEYVIWAGLVPVDSDEAAVNLTDTVGVVRTDWFLTQMDGQEYSDDTPPFPHSRGNAVGPRYRMRVPDIPPGMKLAAVIKSRCGKEGPWGALPDCCHPDIFGIYRQLTLEPYCTVVGRHFGGTVPGIVTTGAKPHGRHPLPWQLFSRFAQRYGYSLRERLYRLFGDAQDDDTCRVRLHYRELVAERFRAAFLEPYQIGRAHV